MGSVSDKRLYGSTEAFPTQYFYSPRRVDHLLDRLEQDVVMKAWRDGFAPGPVKWQMWVEGWPGIFSQMAVVRVQLEACKHD